ncbi:hypothetical protein S40285_10116 [Stachybotrys chlorohalonatus IBT 40285]|uniref:Uncharacterized protein n=1 Tax=Stachybotrys chlorohalonatus (strain IBT 40285) TaxID=1283841 RepID=A0A084QVN0_STAC4|nr:hypothetical protein S40285_10116 [Stachybotrys chlorohalonata IBT 40285]
MDLGFGQHQIPGLGSAALQQTPGDLSVNSGPPASQFASSTEEVLLPYLLEDDLSQQAIAIPTNVQRILELKQIIENVPSQQAIKTLFQKAFHKDREQRVLEFKKLTSYQDQLIKTKNKEIGQLELQVSRLKAELARADESKEEMEGLRRQQSDYYRPRPSSRLDWRQAGDAEMFGQKRPKLDHSDPCEDDGLRLIRYITPTKIEGKTLTPPRIPLASHAIYVSSDLKLMILNPVPDSAWSILPTSYPSSPAIDPDQSKGEFAVEFQAMASVLQGLRFVPQEHRATIDKRHPRELVAFVLPTSESRARRLYEVWQHGVLGRWYCLHCVYGSNASISQVMKNSTDPCLVHGKRNKRIMTKMIGGQRMLDLIV